MKLKKGDSSMNQVNQTTRFSKTIPCTETKKRSAKLLQDIAGLWAT